MYYTVMWMETLVLTISGLLLVWRLNVRSKELREYKRVNTVLLGRLAAAEGAGAGKDTRIATLFLDNKKYLAQIEKYNAEDAAAKRLADWRRNLSVGDSAMWRGETITINGFHYGDIATFRCKNSRGGTKAQVAGVDKLTPVE